MKLILASASARRAEILRAAGIPFTVVSRAVDETPRHGESPEQLVQRLADAKADAASVALAQKQEITKRRAANRKASGPPRKKQEPAIVLAADTEVVLDTEVLGKPRDADDARRMLAKLSGRTHAVITGVTLLRLPDGNRRRFVETTRVQFAEISEEEIARYLATGEPFDKAGAYAIQGRAGRYVPRIEGCYFNIVGLPLARVRQELAALGWTEDIRAGESNDE